MGLEHSELSQLRTPKNWKFCCSTASEKVWFHRWFYIRWRQL